MKLTTQHHQLKSTHQKKNKIIPNKPSNNQKQLTPISQSFEFDESITPSKADRISDAVAKFGGSWKFILSFLAILIVWIVFNTLATTYKFDAYPYILLNLLLSCIAALQAPVIMMSQNRQEQKDRLRNENDYQINLKAETEIRALHEKIDSLVSNQTQQLLHLQKQQIEILKQLNKAGTM